MATAKPLDAPADVDQAIDDPFHVSTSPEVVGAATKPVVSAPVWYAILLAAPPAKLVEVVAVVAEPTDKVLCATYCGAVAPAVST